MMSRIYPGRPLSPFVLPWKLPVILVLLLFGVQPAAAQRQVEPKASKTATGSGQTLASPDQVPEGLTPSDWQSIRAAYEAGQQAYLKASNTGADDQFGRLVAVSGDTVVVGAELEDSSTTGVNSTPNDAALDSGAAYVFVRSGTSWTQQAYLKASNTGAGDIFGVSVAVSGDTLVVGSYAEASSTTGVNSTPNEAAPGSGAAYVFVRSGTSWTEQAYLKASNTGADDHFGYSVAVAGDTVVVGAHYEGSSTTGVNSTPNDFAPYSGAAYVFVRSGTSWTQQAYLKASNTGMEDYFGVSVAVSGDTVVVGAQWEDSSTTGVNSTPNNASWNSGAAYVFVRSGTLWTQQAYLKASNTGLADHFGYFVAMSGETIVVGAYMEDSSTTGVDSIPNDSATDSGAAYVFVRSGTLWTQQAYLKASNTGAGDLFGYSASVSGDTVVVGARFEDSNSTGVNSAPNESAADSGAAYVFVRSGSLWTQQAYLKASNTGAGDQFGFTVAVSGDTVVVGTEFEDSSTTGVNSTSNESASNSGAAYVFAESPVIGVPDAPAIGTAIAGNTTVTVTFTAPASDGGSPITGYIATCGAQSASGTTSPITVTGLTSGTPVTCTVVATNAIGDSEPSAASNSVTPATPRVRVPASTAVREGDAVSIPVELLPAGLSLAGVSASLDYDQTCLTPDADNNGVLDQVTWSAPAGFTTIVNFNSLDTDGEIDLSIVDVNPPIAALPAGVLVQIQFQAICAVPGAEVAAPIVFSSAPSPTFGDVLANNVVGDWTNGIVRILGGPAGDCNGDNLLGIADLTAIGFEIFDGDGEFWLDAPQPTYPGSPVGCDANASTLIQAADVTCANLLIFGGTCSTRAAVVSAPLLEVSTHFEAPLVWLRARLQPNNSAVGSLAFSFDLDRNLFDLAQVDLNQDGRIDHVRFPQGEPDLALVRWDPNDSGGEMDFLLADLSQQQLAEGILVEVGIPAAQPQFRGLFLSAAPAPSFGSATGSDLPGIAVEGLLLFMDGFESGDTEGWLGTFLASAIPMTVPNEASHNPGSYRGRFTIAPALFAGIEAGKETTRVFAVKESRDAPSRFGMIVTWDGAGYQIRGWAQGGADGTLRRTQPVVLRQLPSELSFDWSDASSPRAQDGWLRIFADGVLAGSLDELRPMH